VSRVIAAALEAAGSAARAARVLVRPVSSLAELTTLDRMLAGIWQDDSEALLTTELLRALAKSGNYVAGAFDGGTLVGAAVAFFAAPKERELHSHVTGVVPGAAGRRISTISWTYDPLVARNAHFNLGKLAAVPTEYLPNFYGAMHDRINGDDDSDRLFLRWDLAAPAVVAACAGKPRRCVRPATASVALRASEAGGPVPGTFRGQTVVVAVPEDIEALRRRAPGTAKDWRIAVRETLTALLAERLRFAGFDRSGWYVLTRGAEQAGR
jgi:predicted GNAT superfamily acetyltransferase